MMRPGLSCLITTVLATSVSCKYLPSPFVVSVVCSTFDCHFVWRVCRMLRVSNVLSIMLHFDENATPGRPHIEHVPLRD